MCVASLCLCPPAQLPCSRLRKRPSAAQATTLARGSDPATAAPISMASSTQLTVMLEFADGQRVDMTNDPRTVLTVTSGADLVEARQGGVVSVVAGGAGVGFATVRATFPGYRVGITSLPSTGLSSFLLRLNLMGRIS
jgi:hypothetical protein